MASPQLPATQTDDPYNPLGSRAVIGLDGGRNRNRRRQRRKQFRDRFVTLIAASLAVAATGAVGWYGYQFFREQQDDQLLQDEQNRIEVGPRTGDDLKDAIDDLEENPKWNGPGNPAFGIGGDDQPAP